MKITRRKFLKATSLLSCTPFLLNIMSCTGNASPTEANQDLVFEKQVSAMKVLKISSTNFEKINGKTVICVPNDIVIEFNSKTGKYGVLRKIINNEKTFLQFVVVERISVNDFYCSISGVENKDILLYNPGNAIKQLVQINRALLKSRFLRINENIGV